MKKVLFTATVDSHIELFHVPFLKYFKDNGYEVHVATNGNSDIPYCDKKIKIPFERSPFKVNNLKAIKELKKVIDSENYDIIHTHTPMGSVVTRLASLKARKNGTRVIYTAHGFHFYKGAPLLNWLLFYPVEKILARYTDELITINKEDYNLAKRKFNTNVYYVPGVGIDEKKFDFNMTSEDKSNLRKSLGLNDYDFVMIYPAELNKNKNQLFLINTMEILIKNYPNIHLLLAGKDSYNGFYQKLVNEKNLNKNIHFLGFRNDIPKLLKIADISVSASLREGLPVNIMEAMYVGLPIIATDCRGNRDLITDGINGYVVAKNDSYSFVKRIKELYLNRQKLIEISRKNRTDINKYLLSNIMNDMKNIYERKTKIMHVLASNSFSGAENVACTIIKEFNDEYDMLYVATKGNIEDILIEKNINHILIDKLSFKEIKKALKEFRPDIIHAHDFRASLIVSMLNYKAKKISQIHQNPTWFSRINIKTLLYRLVSRKMDKIALVSESVYNEYVFKNSIENKVLIIPNYVDKHLIINQSKAHFGDHFDVCYFGRLSIEKNPLQFIKLIKLYIDTYGKRISVCIIGDGNLFDECTKLIKEYGLESNIKMLGFMKNPFKVIKNCKCIIMPSIYEGFGLAAVESVCLNKPVLNSGAGGLKEIFKDNKWLICKINEDYIYKLHFIMQNDYNDNFNGIINLYTNLDNYKNNIRKLYK